jgi:hypothetical protein
MFDRAAGEALLHKLDELAAELACFRTELAALMSPAAANGARSKGADDLAPRAWEAQIEALRAAGCERIYSAYPRFRTIQACPKDLPGPSAAG